MIIEESYGLVKNPSMIINASSGRLVDGPTIDGVVDPDKKYSNRAIIGFNPGAYIFEYTVNEMDGPHLLSFYYGSENPDIPQGSPLGRFQILEDGDLLEEEITEFITGTVYGWDLNSFDESFKYGLHHPIVLDPSKEYTIKILVSNDIGDNKLILDYICFTPIPQNSIVNTRSTQENASARNLNSSVTCSSNGTLTAEENLHGYLTYTIPAGGYWEAFTTYTTDFKSVTDVHLRATDVSGRGVFVIKSIDTTNKRINYRVWNLDSVSYGMSGSASSPNITGTVKGYI